MLQLSFVNFKQNSYILVEGTSANDRFFIIQSGRVKCFSEVAIPGTTPEILGPGDFIGVVSCMSGQKLVRVCLMSDIENKFIFRRIKYSVHRHNKLNSAEI